MTSIRRLSDKDVETVFNCMHQNKLPPKSLEFRVVPVGPDGLKLSPPSYEFENGLYVLLKPDKKKTRISDISRWDRPRIPSQLKSIVLDDVSDAICPWSLSGPQFPQPTNIQQRYCYPKGDPEYSSQRGGALWTMYGPNGKEDLEYRLLHVYFSAKRAVNRGVKATETIPSTPNKKLKSSRDSRNSTLTASISSCSTELACESLCSSPLSFTVKPTSPSNDERCYSPPSPFLIDDMSPCELFNDWPDSKDVKKDSFYPVHFVDGNSSNCCPKANFRHSVIYHPKPEHNQHSQQLITFKNNQNSDKDSYSAINYSQRLSKDFSKSPIRHNKPKSFEHEKRSSTDHRCMPPPPAYEPYPFDLDPSLMDFDICCVDPIPLNQLSMPLSQGSEKKDRIHCFTAKLDVIHNQIKDKIMQCPEEQQGHLINVLSGWAKGVASGPL